MKKNKIGVLIGLILLITCIFQIAYAAEENEKTHFVIGSIESSGIASDHGQRILETAYSELGYTTEFVILQAEESLQQSNAGEIDAELFRISGIQETYTNLVPVPVPFVVVENRLFARKDWTEKVTGWDDLIPIVKDKSDLAIRIGLVKGEQQADSRGIPYTRFETIEEALEMLSEGKIDLVYEESLAAYEALDKLGIENVKALESPLDSVALYHYVHKDNSFIVPELEIILTDIVAGNLKVEEEITLTEEEKAWLDEDHTVRAKVIQWPPYMFKSPKVQGVAIDYLNLFAKEFGINIEYVPTEMSFTESIKDIETERKYFDLQLTLKRTPERLEKLAMTEHYFSAPWVIISTKDRTDIKIIEDLEGKTIAVEKGFVIADLVKENYPKIELKYYTTSQEALESVALGKTDAYIGNLAMALYHINKEGLINLKLIDKTPFGNHNQAMATHKDWAPLTTLFDKWLNSLSQSEQAEILNKWIANYKGIESSFKKIELTEEEKAWLKEHPEIVVAHNEEWAPYIFRDSENNLVGVTIEIWDLVKDITGIKEKTYPYKSWSNLFEAAKRKEVDVITSLSYQEARKQWFEYSDAYMTLPTYAFIQKDNSDIRNLEGLKEKHIAIVEGYRISSEIIKDFPNAKITSYDNSKEALIAVSNGNADAYFSIIGTALHQINALGLINLDIGPVYNEPGAITAFGVRNDWPELASIISKALDSIPESKKLEIMNKWVPLTPKISIKLTEEEQAWLDEHKEMRLSGSPSSLPIDFYDGLGTHSGMCSDYVKIINNLLGIDMVPQKEDSWNDVLEKAKEKEIDVIPCIVNSEARREYLTFTEPYLELPLIVVTHEDAPLIEDFDELNGKRIAVIKGFVTQTWLSRDYPEIIQVPAKDNEAVLRLVSEGKADGAIGSFPSMKYTIQRHGIENLRVSVKSPYTFDLSFGVREDWSEMIPILEKAISTISEIDKKNIEDKWTTALIETKIDWVLIFQIAIVIIFTSIFIIIGIVFVMKKYQKELKRQVEERTKNLVKEISTRKKAQDKLEKKTDQLQRFLSVLKGREKRIIELKKKNKE